MDEWRPYWLEFNSFIDETDLDYQLEELTLKEAIDNAKQIITESGISFCTCAIMFENMDGEDEVMGWVNYNSAFDTAPQWKEAK